MKACVLICFTLTVIASKAVEPAGLIAIDPKLFPEATRTDVIKCNEDIAAILSGGFPVHATLGVADKNPDGSIHNEIDGTVLKASMLGDGGTRFYQGDGYRITVWNRWCEIGGVVGYLVGPEVVFEPPLHEDEPEVSNPHRVSFVRFVAGPVVRKKQPQGDLRAADMKHRSPIEQDLLGAIEKIAAERGVTVAEVRGVFAAMNCNSQTITKGGVGLIRDDVFVVASSEKNEAIAGSKTLVGADCQILELFVFSDGKFVGRVPVPGDSASDVIVALYSPEKVRFFDWKDFTGGYFKRWREIEPNKPVETTAPAFTPPAKQESRQP
jgi:hypothetical protein